MRVKILLLATLFLALTSVGFGQNFVACLYYDGYQLTNTCDGGGALADGTPMVIYYDANSNGPDAADQPATVCTEPPDCASGPAGTVNFNTFTINSAAVGLEPGQFLSEPCFTSSGITPNPSRYYVKIVAANGLIWVSAVFTLAVGPQDVNCGPWVCVQPPTPPCDPPSFETVLAPPNEMSLPHACLCLNPAAPGGIHTVYVGPFTLACMDAAPGGLQITYQLVGGPSEYCPSPTCPPAAGWVVPGGLWTWTMINGHRYVTKQIIMPQGSTWGCASLSLSPSPGPWDCGLPVSFGTFSALSLDNAVKLNWTTRSENGVAGFDVLRDGAPIHVETATNTATEHSYSFTDNSALNGTTYTYSLVSVGLDGSRTVEATQAVTPDQNHALVTEYDLRQNFPNPFNPTTTISFDLPEAGHVSLRVYDVAGREVASLVNGPMAAGRQQVSFEGRNLPSGLYFYCLKTGSGFSATKKMLLVK
ncbi:MAG TPA: T9SS type A sorting domain-containing protein [bacterium]|jgi:hypothetical protein